MKERTEELRQEAHRYSDTIRQGADTVLRNALLENMVSEFSERVARLSNEGKDVFDGSLLQAFAENGTEVMYCATLLFLGYVDDATTLPKVMAVAAVRPTSNGDVTMTRMNALGHAVA